jgi:hypothetical protein
MTTIKDCEGFQGADLEKGKCVLAEHQVVLEDNDIGILALLCKKVVQHKPAVEGTALRVLTIQWHVMAELRGFDLIFLGFAAHVVLAGLSME